MEHKFYDFNIIKQFLNGEFTIITPKVKFKNGGELCRIWKTKKRNNQK